MAISLSSSLTASSSSSERFLSTAVVQSRKNFTVTCRTRTETATSGTDFYNLLSLSHKAGPDEIKRAYRTMALKLHPDLCRDPLMKKESAMVFVEVNNAYKTLSDPVSRQEYDLRLSFGDPSSNFRARCSAEGVEMRIWEEEVVELRRRSSCRTARKEKSWGSRMRTRSRD